MRAREARRTMSTRSFSDGYRRFRGRVATPWFHDVWYAALDAPELDRILIQGPREHAKTSVVLTYALRRLAEDHRLRVGIISGSDDLAMKFLKELRYEFEGNEALRRDFNGGADWRGDQWTDHEFVLSDARTGTDGISGKDVSVFSVGQGAQISSRHCDLLIVDDVESAKSVKSELVRQATREWWAREVAPVLSAGGKLVVLGTRKHFDDLYAHLIEGDPDLSEDEAQTWHIVDVAKSVWRPGLPEWAEGSQIWPEMWSVPALRKRKRELDRADLLAWPQEYLNEPRPSGVQMFFPERWPTFRRAPWGLTFYQGWDLAISTREQADYTCGWTVGVSASNEVYLLEQRRGHWDFNRTLAEIGDMGRRWSEEPSGTLAAVGIESVAYQAAAVQEALRRTMLPIVPVKADKEKTVRARLLEARAGQLMVFRPDPPPPWWDEFAAEASFFPDGAHDDQVDGLAHAVRLAGWSSESIAYAMGVWTCSKCGHMFIWVAGRPCPSCGERAPAEFGDPELERRGALGAGIEFWRGGGDAGPGIAQLSPRDRDAADMVEAGEPPAYDPATWAEVRASLRRVAEWYADGGQDVKSQIALEMAGALEARSREPERPAEIAWTVYGGGGNGAH